MMMEFKANVAKHRRRAAFAALVHVTIFLVLLVVNVIALDEVIFRLRHRVIWSNALTACVITLILLWILWQLIAGIRAYARERPRVVPYYNQKCYGRKVSDESVTAFERGYAIAADLARLDALARELHLTPLSNFGFGDDQFRQRPLWRSVQEGIRLVAKLAEHPSLSAATRADLRALMASMQKAAEMDAEFVLLVRYGSDKFISGVEMDRREGSFWI